MNQNEFIIADNLELESYFKQNVNALKDQNIAKRRVAAQNIFNKIVDPNISQSDTICQQILIKIGRELLKSFSDPTEKCREYCIKSIKALLEQSEDNEPILPYLVAVLVERSNCTDLEGIEHLPEVMRPPPSQMPTMLIKFVEESEEVRLQLVELLFTVVTLNDSDKLHEYVDDIVDIQRAFLMDPYAEIQKAACRCLSKFCKVNHQMLLHFTEKMGRAVLFPLISKKSPIRIAALDALNSVLLCGIWKHNAFVFEFLTGFRDPNSVPIKAFYQAMHNVNYLATLIIDPKPSVREAFLNSIGFWLTKLADRWDHHPRLVPYLLSGLFDTDEKIQQTALEIIEEVGKEWEIEKEKDLKDIKQLGIESQWTMEGQLINLELPKPFKSRPRLGSRGFIKSQVRKMWPALYKELLDSNEENRLKASYLVVMGVIFSEEYMTQFLDNFITNTILGIRIGETKVENQILNNLKKTYELIGRYCEYQSYQFIIFNMTRGKFIRDEIFIKSATIALESLCRGALTATIGGIGDKMNLVYGIIDLFCEKDQIEYLSRSNVKEIENLISTLLILVEEKATQEEKELLYVKKSKQLNLLINVITYIQNFSSILLNIPLTNEQINRNMLKRKIQNSEENYDQIGLFGDSSWKNLISEYLYQFDTSYEIPRIIIQFVNSTELPESIDFIQKLMIMIIPEAKTPLHIQNIFSILGCCSIWVLNIKKQTQKLMDSLLKNQQQIVAELLKKKEIIKSLQKDQVVLKDYSTILTYTIKQYPKFYRKQYHQIVLLITRMCDLLLPYPNSKYLYDGENYLLPNLIVFIFDCIDILGENPEQEIRKCLFQLLSYVNQFIPTYQDTFYKGDDHIVGNYQEYMQKLLRYLIEEKDMQSQNIYRVILIGLCKKTRYNFQIEQEQAKSNNQLSRVEILQTLLIQ